MPVTAKMSFRYLWRLALIAIICLGGSLYCLYDGAIAYPKQHDAAVAYQELKDQGLQGNELYERWCPIAAEHGWSKDDVPKDQIDIIWQFVMAGCLVVPGVLYLVFFVRSWGRWIEANDAGLRTSWGQQLEFGQILALDKKKWKKKGIATIAYERDGRRWRLALDDWKYDVKATKTILCAVESRIDAGQIVGGPPEPPDEPPPDEAPQDSQPSDQQQAASTPDHHELT